MDICYAGSHYNLEEENNKNENDKSGENKNPDDKNKNYVDWLNEEKYKERKEFLKHFLTISIAVLTFTIAFRKDIIGSSIPNNFSILISSWIFILISIISAFIYYLLEYRLIFYLRVKKATSKIPKSHYFGKPENFIYTISVFLTPISFLIGLILLSFFVIHNIK